MIERDMESGKDILSNSSCRQTQKVHDVMSKGKIRRNGGSEY